MKVPESKLYTKLLLRLNPKLGIRKLIKDSGHDSNTYETLNEIFANTKTIDFERPATGDRGLIITLDHGTRLFFYQNGAAFIYDGFEVGKYEKGDVTALDR